MSDRSGSGGADGAGGPDRRGSGDGTTQGGEFGETQLSWQERNEQWLNKIQNPTQLIYRSSDFDKAVNYVTTGDPKYITTAPKPGDFNKAGEEAAYFAIDRRYAEHLAKSNKQVIQQTVPRSWLWGGRAVVYAEEPDDAWRQRVFHDRGSRPLPGQARATQKVDITIGPIADTFTGSITRSNVVPAPAIFKPAMNPEGGYYQQVAIKGQKLNEIGTYPRESYNPRDPSNTHRRST